MEKQTPTSSRGEEEFIRTDLRTELHVLAYELKLETSSQKQINVSGRRESVFKV